MAPEVSQRTCLGRQDTELTAESAVEAIPQTITNTQGKCNYDLMRSWLYECQHEYSRCSRQAPALPKRVVDVGIAPHFDGLKLLVPQTRTIAEYVTHSTVWGGKSKSLLTTKTLAAFQQAIEYHTLPATFRDAVTVTRQLGIKYLWIDCLCVLQDSKADWEDEAQNMSSRYRTSILTISIPSSSSADHAFLASASLDYTAISLLTAQEIEAPMFVSLASRAELDWRWYYAECVLNSRWWALQESVLAPRQIIFGQKQVYWRCLEQRLRLLTGEMVSEWGEDWIGIDRYVMPIIHDWNHKVPMSDLISAYLYLVEIYCACDLTDPSDKLSAFSGLIVKVFSVIGSDHVVGVWGKAIRPCLAWSTLNEEESLDPQTLRPYLAPTWSWASTNTPVAFDKPTTHRQVEDDLPGGLILLRTHSRPKTLAIHLVRSSMLKSRSKLGVRIS